MTKYTQNVMARVFLDIWAYNWLKPGPHHNKREFKRVSLSRKTESLVRHDRYLAQIEEKGLLHPKD